MINLKDSESEENFAYFFLNINISRNQALADNS
jgi:hypothetical protein